MTAMTPIFTYDPRFVRRVHLGHETANFPVFNRIAQIQGSSLKGVIRSLIEAIEPCCVAVPAPFRKTYRGTGITRGKELTVRLPAGFEHCDEGIEPGKGRCWPKALCPACRLFGSLDPGGRWAYAGKVSIGDARSAPGEYQLLPHVTLDVLSTPK
ncbi:MAG: RAMP superfamily CRISPR-associated protein, partial [Gammaproteobacteria bacterium]